MFKKAVLSSLISLSAIGAVFAEEDTRCNLDCKCEHFSWLGQKTNGVPGLILECKKQLPGSLQKVFDDSLERWETYLHENHGDFDIETLLKAVAFAAPRNDMNDMRHLLGSMMLLWDVGHVRTVNVLAASLVRNSKATIEEIEWQFGPEVRRIVEEIRLFPAEKAEHISLSSQLIILSDRLQNFLEHKRGQDPISVDEQRKLLHSLRGTSDTLEHLYESYLDDQAAAQN